MNAVNSAARSMVRSAVQVERVKESKQEINESARRFVFPPQSKAGYFCQPIITVRWLQHLSEMTGAREEGRDASALTVLFCHT